MKPPQIRNLAIAALCACAGLAAQTPAPAPPQVPTLKERPAYRIGPGDVLQINVWNEAQVSQPSIVVLPDGKVNLPLIHEVSVAGSTVQDAEKLLAGLFKPFITDPEVTVVVKESNSQRIFIVGAVRKEGPIKLVTQLTVLQAIAEAGGLSEFAHKKEIYVLRNEAGKQISLGFDYTAVIRGQKAAQNIVLQPGDTVVVP